jgi:hypothetical protein
MQTTKKPLRRLLAHHTRSSEEHLVTDGRLACPRSAVAGADLDRCYSCPLLDDIRVDSQGRTWVRCHPAARILTPAELRGV